VIAISAGFVGYEFTPTVVPQIPFHEKSNVELATFTLQRMNRNCAEEWAELQSRFQPMPQGVDMLPRLSPRGLARRLLELENIEEVSNHQLSNRVFSFAFEHDYRFHAEMLSRLAAFDDLVKSDTCMTELAFRLREWDNLSSILEISTGIRDILLVRLSVFEGRTLHELETIELARRLLDWERHALVFPLHVVY
jgi:hypothetical protein